MFAHGETVTRLRGTPVVDPYSGESTGVDWSNPDELEIDGCAFNPGQSAEPTEVGRNAVITQPEVYTEVGADVLAGDRLIVRGRTYEVDGDPSDWRSPFTGWEAGLTVTLKIVEG